MNKLRSGKAVFLTVNSNNSYFSLCHIPFWVFLESFVCEVSCWLQNDGNILEGAAMNSFNRCFLSTWSVKQLSVCFRHQTQMNKGPSPYRENLTKRLISRWLQYMCWLWKGEGGNYSVKEGWEGLPQGQEVNTSKDGAVEMIVWRRIKSKLRILDYKTIDWVKKWDQDGNHVVTVFQCFSVRRSCLDFGAAGIKWFEVRDAEKCLWCTGQPLTTNNSLA